MRVLGEDVAVQSARRRVLESYLVELRRAGGEDARGPELGAWEKQQIRRWLDTEPTGPSDARLTAESLALLAKVTADVARLRSAVEPDETALYAVQAELLLNGALGMLMLRELQIAVDDAVRSGRMDHARSLSRLRHRLHRAAGEVRRILVTSEWERAEALARTLDAATGEESSRSRAQAVRVREGRVAPRETTRRSRRRRAIAASAQLVSGPTRTAFLAIALAALAGTWSVLFGIPRFASAAASEPVLDGMAGAEAISEVRARPPSLFIEVQPEIWNELDLASRRDLVGAIGRAALSRGYTGAVLESVPGHPVARWLERRGSELIDDLETPHSELQSESGLP